jgi:hypothetical protein
LFSIYARSEALKRGKRIEIDIYKKLCEEESEEKEKGEDGKDPVNIP